MEQMEGLSATTTGDEMEFQHTSVSDKIEHTSSPSNVMTHNDLKDSNPALEEE